MKVTIYSWFFIIVLCGITLQVRDLMAQTPRVEETITVIPSRTRVGKVTDSTGTDYTFNVDYSLGRIHPSDQYDPQSSIVARSYAIISLSSIAQRGINVEIKRVVVHYQTSGTSGLYTFTIKYLSAVDQQNASAAWDDIGNAQTQLESGLPYSGADHHFESQPIATKMDDLLQSGVNQFIVGIMCQNESANDSQATIASLTYEVTYERQCLQCEYYCT